jgi:hypothetical protein
MICTKSETEPSKMYADIGAAHMGRIEADNELPQRIVRHAEFELLALAGHWRIVPLLPERLFFQACANRRLEHCGIPSVAPKIAPVVVVGFAEAGVVDA